MQLVDISNDHARNTLKNILNTTEFTQARQFGELEELIKRFLESINIFGFNKNIEGGVTFFEVLVVLAGLIIVIYLIRMTIPFWNLLTGDVMDVKASETFYLQPTPTNLLIEAEKKALQGNFRLALRDLYLSLLLEMDKRQLIKYGSAKTNSEYLREIHGKGAKLEGIFSSLVKLFEYKWYGLENCDWEDFQKGRVLYSTLLEEASHG